MVQTPAGVKVYNSGLVYRETIVYISFGLTPSDPLKPKSNMKPSLEQKYIAELKEAFHYMDHDGDGVIDEKDLEELLPSLGMLIFTPISPIHNTLNM